MEDTPFVSFGGLLTSSLLNPSFTAVVCSLVPGIAVGRWSAAGKVALTVAISVTSSSSLVVAWAVITVSSVEGTSDVTLPANTKRAAVGNLCSVLSVVEGT